VIRRYWQDEYPLRWRLLDARFQCNCRKKNCACCLRCSKAKRAVSRWLGIRNWYIISPQSPGSRADYFPINGYTIFFHQYFDLIDECQTRGCEMIAVFAER